MSSEDQKEIAVIYEQLLGLFHGLGEPDKDNQENGGPIIQYQHVIDRLSELTGKNLDHFLPDSYKNDMGIWYKPIDLKTQTSSLLSWLRASYLPGEKIPHYVQSLGSTMSISQTVNQEVSVMQVVTLDISELLTAKQSDFEEGTPERTFIERVKGGLRTVKDTAALLALIMQTAQQCGLSAAQLHKVFS